MLLTAPTIVNEHKSANQAVRPPLTINWYLFSFKGGVNKNKKSPQIVGLRLNVTCSKHEMFTNRKPTNDSVLTLRTKCCSICLRLAAIPMSRYDLRPTRPFIWGL